MTNEHDDDEFEPSEFGDLYLIVDTVPAWAGLPSTTVRREEVPVHPGNIVMSLGVLDGGRDKFYLIDGFVCSLPEDHTFYTHEARKIS